SPVKSGSIAEHSPPAAERSGAGGGESAGGRSLTPGRRAAHAVDKLDRRRPGGSSPNSRWSAAAKRSSSHARGRDASMSTAIVPVHVGIDVSKAKLDVCLL